MVCVGRDPKAHPDPPPAMGREHLLKSQIISIPIQPGLGYFQVLRIHSFSVKPVSGARHCHMEEILPNIPSNQDLWHLKAIPLEPSLQALGNSLPPRER